MGEISKGGCCIWLWFGCCCDDIVSGLVGAIGLAIVTGDEDIARGGGVLVSVVVVVVGPEPPISATSHGIYFLQCDI